MKPLRLVLALFVGLPVLLVLGFWPVLFQPGPPPEPAVVSRFLGFTNGFTARFALSNYPRNERNFPTLTEIAHRENGVWRRADTATVRRTSVGMSYTVPEYVISIPVITTSQPVRFVLEFPREAIGWRGMVNDLYSKRGKPPRYRGRGLTFTNETGETPVRH